jgi:hypothetical protein
VSGELAAWSERLAKAAEALDAETGMFDVVRGRTRHPEIDAAIATLLAAEGGRARLLEDAGMLYAGDSEQAVELLTAELVALVEAVEAAVPS